MKQRGRLKTAEIKLMKHKTQIWFNDQKRNGGIKKIKHGSMIYDLSEK
jgi:hypothetical protein